MFIKENEQKLLLVKIIGAQAEAWCTKLDDFVVCASGFYDVAYLLFLSQLSRAAHDV